MNFSSKLRCKDKHNICNNAAYHKINSGISVLFYTMQCLCTPRH